MAAMVLQAVSVFFHPLLRPVRPTHFDGKIYIEGYLSFLDFLGHIRGGQNSGIHESVTGALVSV